MSSHSGEVHKAFLLVPRACPTRKSWVIAMVALNTKCVRDSPSPSPFPGGRGGEVCAGWQRECHTWKHLQAVVVRRSHTGSCVPQWAARAAATGLTLPPQLDTLQPLWAHLGKPSQGFWSPPAPGAWHRNTGSPPRGNAPCCPVWPVIVANLVS